MPVSSEGRSGVCRSIVESVAETKGVDPLDLRPLHYAVDADAINDLCEHGFDGSLEFQYAECTVTVHGDGRVRVASTQQEKVRA